eukprot:6194173-Amphidinium_carterae.1
MTAQMISTSLPPYLGAATRELHHEGPHCQKLTGQPQKTLCGDHTPLGCPCVLLAPRPPYLWKVEQSSTM